MKIRKGSSIVVIILIITLFISIAILSISTTNSSLKLAERLANRVTEYYNLQSETNKSLGLIIDELNESNYKNIDGLAKSLKRKFVSENLSCSEISIKDDIINYDIGDINGRSMHVVLSLAPVAEDILPTSVAKIGEYSLTIISICENQKSFETVDIKFKDIK